MSRFGLGKVNNSSFIKAEVQNVEEVTSKSGFLQSITDNM